MCEQYRIGGAIIMDLVVTNIPNPYIRSFKNPNQVEKDELQ